MVLWNTCQIMRCQTATHGKKLDWYDQGGEKIISPGGQMKNLDHILSPLIAKSLGKALGENNPR